METKRMPPQRVRSYRRSNPKNEQRDTGKQRRRQICFHLDTLEPGDTKGLAITVPIAGRGFHPTLPRTTPSPLPFSLRPPKASQRRTTPPLIGRVPEEYIVYPSTPQAPVSDIRKPFVTGSSFLLPRFRPLLQRTAVASQRMGTCYKQEDAAAGQTHPLQTTRSSSRSPL